MPWPLPGRSFQTPHIPSSLLPPSSLQTHADRGGDIGRIHPEPGAFDIRILQPGFHSVQVADARGSIRLHREGTGFQRYRVSGLPGGIYTVTMEVNARRLSRRVPLSGGF